MASMTSCMIRNTVGSAPLIEDSGSIEWDARSSKVQTQFGLPPHGCNVPCSVTPNDAGFFENQLTEASPTIPIPRNRATANTVLMSILRVRVIAMLANSFVEDFQQSWTIRREFGSGC